MPVFFKARSSQDRDWRTLNDLHVIMDGRGALFGTLAGAIHLTTRLGASWSSDTMKVEIGSDRFRDIAQAMMDADPARAMDAFGAALMLGARRPVHDEDGRELG